MEGRKKNGFKGLKKVSVSQDSILRTSSKREFGQAAQNLEFTDLPAHLAASEKMTGPICWCIIDEMKICITLQLNHTQQARVFML